MEILTILGAICTRGMIAAMTIEAATDREIFLAYLDEVLCPKLRIGDVVIMDNLSSHKVQGVRERIEAAGASCSTCALLAGLEPHRKGMGQAQTTAAHSQRRAQNRPSTKPLPNCYQCSLPKTQEPGSGSLSALYNNRRNTLIASSCLDFTACGKTQWGAPF